VVFEKMLVGNTLLHEPDALLLAELSNQNMEIGNLLVRSGTTIYNEMYSFRVPDLLDTYLTKNLDRQRSSVILGHGHVRRKNSNLARKVDLPASVSFDANDLLGKRKRVTVEDYLRQVSLRRNENCPLLKMKLKRPQCILVVVESEKMHGEIFKLADWNVSVTNQPMSEIARSRSLGNWVRIPSVPLGQRC
jgi:predicted SpoU family rRNA methylase